MIGWWWMFACSGGGPAVETAAPQPVDPVQAVREQLHTAEEALLAQRAEAALATGDVRGALVAVRMGLEVAPARFGPLADRLQAEATTAEGHRLLAEAFAADADRAADLRARATELEVAERWVEDRRAESIAATEGITGEVARTVLAGVVEEYVVAPDTAAMARGASERLARVGEAWGLAPSAEAGEVPDAVAAAVAAGLPAPVAWMEGVDGALAALDPYTRAVWPAELAGWEQHHAGVVVGVGLSLLDAPDGGVIVEHPEPDGPAWEAGLHQGDRVVRLAAGDDTLEVAELPAPRADAVAAALAGAEGTGVHIDVERGDEALGFDLERAPVPVPTVSGWQRGADNQWSVEVAEGIDFVRISAFRSSTDEAVRALMEGRSPGGVILDLRGNGGGDVSAAVNVADLFVGDGELAHLAGRTATEPELAEGEVAWNVALPGDPLEGVPVAVLVDRDTASAAEILAGALRERAGAVLVGERTFGKGLSQALRTDPEGRFGWQVTNLMWTLPSGAPVESPSEGEGGLAPDVAVSLSPAERFQVAVMRRQREALRVHSDGTPMRYLGTTHAGELPVLPEDPGVRAARRALASQASSSQAPPPTPDEGGEAQPQP